MELFDSDKLIREVMVYSFKKVTVTKVRVHHAILSALVLVCAACGVRGPLTIDPKLLKGLDEIAAPAPTDIRAAPASAVLFGSDGKRTIIAAPTTVPVQPVAPAGVNPN